MEVLYPRCCGLDIHKKTVVACLLTTEEGQPPVKVIRTFRTMTVELLALANWLHTAACTHVAMESTGVYWRPIYNLLEGLFELLVVNAQHIKAVPGRKTDVKDAEWIAELLRHGLLRGSFIPSKPQRQLQELTRHRTTSVPPSTRSWHLCFSSPESPKVRKSRMALS
jgi:transposase